MGFLEILLGDAGTVIYTVVLVGLTAAAFCWMNNPKQKPEEKED